METQTHFDLNAAIVNWQQELAQEPDLTPVVRRELETHLRDTVTELQARGLNNEESFWLARRRVGYPDQLGREFAKADPAKFWRERVFWMVLAGLTIGLWSAFVSFLLTLLNPTRTIVGGMILSNVVVLFCRWLPIVACAVLLAKGKLAHISHKWALFMNSRLRVAVAIAIWILVDAVIVTSQRWELLRHLAFDRVGWVNLWSNLFYVTVWPSILLGLLLWLMPKTGNPASKGV